MEVIQQIGAYTGFAAVIGLAVLSALYFSQARDLRRLREWAARMSATGGRAGVESPPQTAPGTERPGQASPTGAGASASATGAGAPASATDAGAASAGASGAGSREAAGATALGTGTPAPSTPLGLRLPSRTSEAISPAARAPAAGNSRGGPPPHRGDAAPRAVNGRPASQRTDRSSLPYVVLAVVGALIVIGAGAFAIGLIGGGGGPAPEVTAGGSTGSRGAPMPDPRSPASVTFSVLNGTGVAGQAKQVADELESAGYRRGNVTNASARKAESVVLYNQGARPEALAVARRLDITQTEAIDSASQTLAGDASVVVVVGADQTR